MDAELTRRRRRLALYVFSSALAIGMSVLGTAAIAAGQSRPSEAARASRPSPPSSPSSSAASKRAVPRTADGHPDLQGTWFHGTLTPLERPVALGTKALYTAAEREEAARQIAERRANPQRTARPGDVGTDNEAFVDEGYTLLDNGQTSLIVDPPDGRLPLTPEAVKRAAFNNENRDDYETMSPWDRCITRGPTLMLPAGYNNGTRIVQSKGLVMIEAEMVHEARIVPTDARPHLPSSVRTWLGDAVGRWDGDTLVIDSTNFHDRGWLSTYAASGRLRGVPHSQQLHIVERFTMTDANTITYELTVDDPPYYSRPWTASVPLRRDDSYLVYEAACHEGNQAIELVLRGRRFEDQNRP